MIDDDQVDRLLTHLGSEFLDLARAKEVTRVGGFAIDDKGGHHLGSGGFRQSDAFGHRFFGANTRGVQMDDDGPFATLGPIK